MNVTVELTKMECGCCSGVYAISERFREKCYEEGKSWTCPYCKVGWGYENNNSLKIKNEKTIAALRKENKDLKDQLSRPAVTERDLPERLLELRLGEGYTQKQLAEELGISASDISRKENGWSTSDRVTEILAEWVNENA